MHPLDQIAIMQLHIVTSPVSATSPLFSFCSKDRTIPLLRTAFISRCNTIWSANGMPRITGHSFHIGGTTELLLAGVPPGVMKALGRWFSDIFLIYWQSLSELAPLYVANLPSHPSTI
ncbi:hypothetical protein M422DRAFT_160088 [Sphaerobolus stellatus SS14]|nr:hypothetical protein M422DRAFT_160088 [Sphaerobolus stellatus SS14]